MSLLIHISCHGLYCSGPFPNVRGSSIVVREEILILDFAKENKLSILNCVHLKAWWALQQGHGKEKVCVTNCLESYVYIQPGHCSSSVPERQGLIYGPRGRRIRK